MERNYSYTMTVRMSSNDDKCFGPGIADLLELVRELRSLRAAASRMRMAYSKAWRIVKEMEAALGFPLLTSVTGGVNGGGASLTPQAEDMLRRYRAFVEESRHAADQAFERYFG